MRFGPSHRILAAALLTASCIVPRAGGAQEPSEQAEITGVVIDVDGGAGIGDVIIRIEGTLVSAASDEDGRFVLRGIPAGTWTLQVEHVAYGVHEHLIAVEAGERSNVQIRLAQEAIELEPLIVEGETSLQRQRRTTGSSFWEVDRERIVRAIGTSRHMGDVLRQVVPGLSLRQANNLSQTDVCLEFRGAASISIVNARACNHPMVLLDGVVVTNPQYLYGSVGMENLERIQVIPPGEAGARYGTGSLYGVILIETQRPGPIRTGPDARDLVGDREALTFDWTSDPAGHDTDRAFLGALVGNAVGLTLGLLVSRQCIRVDADDEIATSCGATTNVLAGLSAFALPAAGSALGVRWAGGTELSVGRMVPAVLGAGMMLFPGYAFSMSTVGGDRPVVNSVGHTFLALGVPLAVTLADRLFRTLRR